MISKWLKRYLMFVVCCMLHNQMLPEMESGDTDACIGCCVPFTGDEIWLCGNFKDFAKVSKEGDNRSLTVKWGRRWSNQAKHIYFCDRIQKRMK